MLTVIDKTIIEPLPYERPGDLYFVSRDYSSFFDLTRGWLGGPDVADVASVGGPTERSSSICALDDRRSSWGRMCAR